MSALACWQQSTFHLERMSLTLPGLDYPVSLAYCAPWPEECADTRPLSDGVTELSVEMKQLSPEAADKMEIEPG